MSKEMCHTCWCSTCETDTCSMGRTPCGQNLRCHAPVLDCAMLDRFEKKAYDAAIDRAADQMDSPMFRD